MIPWWGWVLSALLSGTVVTVVVMLDRRRIRDRISADGGRVIAIWGPFPSTGIDQRMELRRYSVTFRDRDGRGCTATAVVSMWYFRLDLDP